MKFHTLQENLRKVLLERIRDGSLTGLLLAERTGFKQAHISNFLNRKRGLSLEGMDRVLSVECLSVLDLIETRELKKRPLSVVPAECEFANVVVTGHEAAATQPVILSMHVKGVLQFQKAFLKRLRREAIGGRSDWQRFVVIEAGPQDGAGMYPRIREGAALLLDRHYNSLTPYRKGEKNLYAVRKSRSCSVRYLEMSNDHLVLRSHNETFPVELLAIGHGRKPTDYVVGRICYVGSET